MHTRVSKRHTQAADDERLGFVRNSNSDYSPDALRLLPVWPKDLADRTLAGRQTLIAIIEREVRKERRLGVSGHRSYNIARHANLVRLLKVERDAVRELARRDNGARVRAGTTRCPQP